MVFFPKIIPIEHFFDTKIPKFCQVLSNIYNFFIVNNVIMLYDSDCAIYIPSEETKRL